MLSQALSTVRGWVVRRKALLAAVIRVAAKPVLAYATGNQAVGDTYGDLLGAGLAEALDLVGDAKPKTAGAAAEVDEVFQRRLEEMGRIAAPLLDKLEQLSETTAAPANRDAVEARVVELLRKHASLQAELGQLTPALREQILSLPRIEAKLDEVVHVALKLPSALEEFKRFLIQSPLFNDWEQFRRADPEAMQLVIEADAHFLAGRRKEGIACLQRLFALRGVGNPTLAHHLGLHQIGAGDLPAARATMAMFPDGAPLPDHLSRTIADASTCSRAGGGAVWRGLPQGFEIGYKFRIEAEIGRGGRVYGDTNDPR